MDSECWSNVNLKGYCGCMKDLAKQEEKPDIGKLKGREEELERKIQVVRGELDAKKKQLKKEDVGSLRENDYVVVENAAQFCFALGLGHDDVNSKHFLIHPNAVDRDLLDIYFASKEMEFASNLLLSMRLTVLFQR